MYTFNASCVKTIAYNSTTETLFVEFASGKAYEYFRVPSHIYDAMQEVAAKGESIASFVTKKIVHGGYKFAKSNLIF